MIKEVIDYFMEKGILLSPDFVNSFNGDCSLFYDKVVSRVEGSPLVINDDLFLVVNNVDQVLRLNWFEFDKARVVFEKEGACLLYDSFLDVINYNLSEEKLEILSGSTSVDSVIEDSSVVIVKSYEEPIKKKVLGDFVSYFRNRYEALKRLLVVREQLQGSVSINRVLKRGEKESVALIGLVKEKSITKNGNVMFTIEDVTGEVRVLVTKARKQLYEKALEIMLDEVVGVTGVTGRGIIFGNDLFYPDISVTNEVKKCVDDVYAIFISDVHIGLKEFLSKDFENFIGFLNGSYGSKVHKDIASKVKYLFIVGDLVEGVGIYPGQEKDLVISNVKEQYEEFYNYVSRIPTSIKVILCGGNHDALRLAEPQPPLDRRYCSRLYSLSNVYIVSNPGMVNIHSSKDFTGFNVLMYHGSSFFYYADNINSIRMKGGVKRTDLLMKYLLQRRHLAPSHSSALYIPDVNFDPLVIDKVPDFFVTGHLHTLTTANYRSVTLINCGCWCGQTDEQERRGIVPEPSKVPIVNLKTREVKIMNFRGV